MSKSIVVFGAGPGLGQAVARCYAQDGYDVVLIARSPASLDAAAQIVRAVGGTAHPLAADLADTGAVPALAVRIRERVGDPDTLYYAPTPDGFMIPATELTPERVAGFMPLAVYTLIALVREFLPAMIERGSGAILTAQGASAVQGRPNLSGPGPAQAAQRNYLQSLHDEVAGGGVYVGMLYIGAIIENSAFHAAMDPADDWGPVVDPAVLADTLRSMHAAGDVAERHYP